MSTDSYMGTPQGILLKVENAGKLYAPEWVLSNVDFELKSGEIHALVGENGAGKSTLCKIIAGFVQLDGGRLEIEGEEAVIADPRDAMTRGISMIAQEPNVVPTLTVAENMMLGKRKGFFVNRSEIKRQASEVLARLSFDIDPETKVEDLQFHDRQLADIAKAISHDARILIMDEPGSALDNDELSHLFTVIRRLRDLGHGILYVSHILRDVIEIADRVTVLRGGRNVGTFPISQVDVGFLVETMIGQELEQVSAKQKPQGTAREVLRLDGISSSPEVVDVSLNAKAGEIVGIGGLVGSGHGEVGKILFGDRPVTAGKILLDGKAVSMRSPHDAMQLGVGYVPPYRGDALVPDMTLRQNISLPSLRDLFDLFKGKLWRWLRDEESLAKSQVSLFEIVPPELDKPMREFSSGNQQRAMLARWFVKKGIRLLVVDSPTNAVDVKTRAYLHELFAKSVSKETAMIVISSDVRELMQVCTRIYIMRKGTIAAEFPADESMEAEALSVAAS